MIILMSSFLHRCAEDENPHIRRLVSEGTRPRLPWAVCLSPFIEDPGPTLALLEKLKDDPSEYVRRSVSNHLNDIAKDHPRLVVEQMSFSLQSTVVTGQNLVIDFVIHFVKANGQTSGKVFKLKTAVLLPNEALAVTKSHPIRPITTRTYHPGTHRVQIQVNGQIVGERSFELVLP